MIAIAAPLLLASPAFAAGTAPWVAHGFLAPVIQVHMDFIKRHAILEVRQEGLRLQAGDGGRLTDEHREYLQAKLNAVLHGNY
jgi:hypothetical protein